jgi:isopentenyl-diphosphate delta-isomerase
MESNVPDLRVTANDPCASDPSANDLLILVDLADREIGTEPKLACHLNGHLHRAFSVFLFDGNRVLMQRRAPGKYHSGGLWTNSCCSHPRTGETLAQTVPRRLGQELGVTGVACREAGVFCYRAAFPNGITEYEMDHVFVGQWAGTPAPDPAEVMDWLWVDASEVAARLREHPEEFTAWLPGALPLAFAAAGVHW